MIIYAAIKKDGQVYLGRRHHEILNDIARPRGFLKLGQQGFVNDKGQFLTREQAAQEAIACGQIKELKYSTKDLFSEEILL